MQTASSRNWMSYQNQYFYFNIMPVIIEICTDSLWSAMVAEQHGAHRIELCAGLGEGGVTPSQGTIQAVVSKLKIPVNGLIRPRPGNFHYSKEEIDSMLKDIAFCKEAGAAGVVIGALKKNGTIDTENSKRFIDALHPLDATYHRAFDVTDHPLEALEQIIELGYHRILTSGQMMSAFEGRFNIASYIKAAKDRICIMPGAGINERTITELYKCTHATEYHMSLRIATSKDHCLESLSTNSTLLNVSGKRITEVLKITAAFK
jgi:copper homeostasis protein